MTLRQFLRILFISITLSVPFALLSLFAFQAGQGMNMGQAWQHMQGSPLFGSLFFRQWGVLFLALLIGISFHAVWPDRRRQGNGRQRGPRPQGRNGRRRGQPRDREGARPAAPAPRPVEGPRQRGTVKWFNSRKGYGFILLEDGTELFVHYREIRGEGRRTLQDGQAVEFGIGEGRKGPEARDVQPLT